jgi:SAM-dependent methyltransferase
VTRLARRPLRDTGERVVPEWVEPGDRLAVVFLEQHLGRYDRVVHHARGRRVLDAGCGVGYGCRALADGGATTVVGVDVSPAAINYAEAHYGGPCTRFVVGEPSDPPGAPFDVVTCFEVLQHVPDPHRFLAGLRRVLAPDGRLFVSGTVYPTRNLYRYHLHDLTETSFKELLVASGFAVLDTFVQRAHIAPVDVRRAMFRHRQSFPVGRLARTPRDVLGAVWRSHVTEGLDHTDVTLMCEHADRGGTAASHLEMPRSSSHMET